jgi:hypothetical protein
LINEIATYPEGMKYILHLRGVFKTYRMRRSRKPAEAASAAMLASGKAASQAQLDDKSKQVLRRIMDLMKPHLRA